MFTGKLSTPKMSKCNNILLVSVSAAKLRTTFPCLSFLNIANCLEKPMDRGAWQATVHGLTRVRHDLVTKPPP